MRTLLQVITSLLRDDSGVTALEYALIAFLIFLAIFMSVSMMADSIHVFYNSVAKTISEL